MKTAFLKIGMIGMMALTFTGCSELMGSQSLQGSGVSLSPGNKITLHEVKTKVFGRPYSCGLDAGEKFNYSYEKSALFITDYSKQRNSPELLFEAYRTYGDKSCYNFHVMSSTVVGDVSFIVDLGNVSLEEALRQSEFGSLNFKEKQPVVPNHTYLVVLGKREIQAIYAFRVVSLGSELGTDNSMVIEYAVKNYSAPGVEITEASAQKVQP